MKRFSILAALGALLVSLAPAVRAQDASEDFQKILRELQSIRQITEREARARAEETRALRAALDDARQELLRAHQQQVDLTAKLNTAEAELKRQLSKSAAIDKFAAEIDKSELRPVEEYPIDLTGIEVRGKITSISDTGLFLMSIGADIGLKQGDVVQIIHPGEPPRPLGAMVLVRAYAKQSIGEFKGKGDRPAVGDEVGVRGQPK